MASRKSLAIGVGLLILAALSVQSGAAVATSLMPIVGIWVVLMFRYVVMSISHSALSYRHLKTVRFGDLKWALAFAVPMLFMNTAIYVAFSRIGLGLAVSIELLGPIGLAVVVARSALGWSAGALALVGMVCVAGPTFASDPIGILAAVLAALGWAGYLVMGRVAGQHLPGLVPLAVASSLGLFILAPAAVISGGVSQIDGRILALGIVAGLLSSAIPYAADLMALRRVPLEVASNLQSLHPVAAALFGALILGERLGFIEILGLLIISLSNILVVRGAKVTQGVSTDTGALPVVNEDG